MRFSLSVLSILCIVAQLSTSQSHLHAQVPTASPEYDVLKKDLGEWDIEITNFASGAPEVTKGSETTTMLGEFWLISNFKGTMMGLDFQGHGNTGYDAESKKYVGTWIDSLSPGMMQMKGDYDKESESMTLVGMAPGMDGNPAKHRLTTSYKNGKRVMTMYITPKDGEEAKFMTMVYTKKEK
ncbi:MAG: DUF1579 domain-containing protein [Mariniblastus sp.]